MTLKQLALFGDPVAVKETKEPRIKNFADKTCIGDFIMYGGGLQSTVILYMIHAGILPKPLAVIHANTGNDGIATVRHVMRMRELMESIGVPFYNIQQSWTGIAEHIQQGKALGSMPVYVDTGSKKAGMLRRQCTEYYKILPTQNAMKEVLCKLGYAHPQKGFEKISGEFTEPIIQNWLKIRNHEYRNFPRIVVHGNHYVRCAFGITTDEMYRANERGLQWQKTWYPLIEMGMSRDDCTKWCVDNGYRIPPKSACVFCPYKSDESWLSMYREHLAMMKIFAGGTTDWMVAVEVDKMLRNPDIIAINKKAYSGINGTMYLHASMKPLDEIDFESLMQKAHPQMTPMERALKIEIISNAGSCKSNGAFSCHS